MKVTGVKCPNCKEEIWSKHRHDWHQCRCGDTFVDGGRDYLRYGGKNITTIEKVEIETEE